MNAEEKTSVFITFGGDTIGYGQLKGNKNK